MTASAPSKAEAACDLAPYGEARNNETWHAAFAGAAASAESLGETSIYHYDDGSILRWHPGGSPELAFYRRQENGKLKAIEPYYFYGQGCPCSPDCKFARAHGYVCNRGALITEWRYSKPLPLPARLSRNNGELQNALWIGFHRRLLTPVENLVRGKILYPLKLRLGLVEYQKKARRNRRKAKAMNAAGHSASVKEVCPECAACGYKAVFAVFCAACRHCGGCAPPVCPARATAE